jgi:DNA-binding helix-hairpin-helix protein with protein kinase domain
MAMIRVTPALHSIDWRDPLQPFRRPLLTAPRRLAALALVLCSGTLVCCALPALLVVLGAGSVLATALSWWPGLSLLSEQKTVVFGLAAAALLIAGVALRQSARLPCPINPETAQRCRKRRRQAKTLYALSCTLFGIGSLAAFVLPLLAWR